MIDFFGTPSAQMAAIRRSQPGTPGHLKITE
jgi:hypothetical protein